jgi:Ca2+/H+ antiporter, TMEM165/GDT1 family
MKKFWFLKVIVMIVCFAGAVLLFGAIVMGLWNAILPEIIGVKAISFVQALGILLLSKILFGGFGGRGGWKDRKREWGDRKKEWNEIMKGKWEHMTPEEKEKFKAEWRNRCGKWGRKPADTGTMAAE